MANWARIKKLRRHIAALKPKQIRMDKLLLINREKETAGQARRVSCGTVGCLAGHAMCLFMPHNQVLAVGPTLLGDVTNVAGVGSEDAYDLLGLTDTEADYMFLGGWFPGIRNYRRLTSDALMVALSAIKRRDVLAYLDKAIAEKNVMVSLDPSRAS